MHVLALLLEVFWKASFPTLGGPSWQKIAFFTVFHYTPILWKLHKAVNSYYAVTLPFPMSNCSLQQNILEKKDFVWHSHDCMTFWVSDHVPSQNLSSTIYHLPSIVYCLLSIIHCPSAIVYLLSTIDYCLSSIVYRLSSIIYHLLSIIYPLSSTVYSLS